MQWLIGIGILIGIVAIVAAIAYVYENDLYQKPLLIIIGVPILFFVLWGFVRLLRWMWITPLPTRWIIDIFAWFLEEFKRGG